MFQRLLWVLVLLDVMFGWPDRAAAQAQSKPDEVEIWGGLEMAGPRPDGSLTTSYSPVLRFFTSTGQAGQTLDLDGARTVGPEFGLNYFPVKSAGVQVLFGHDRFDLAGPSSPYVVHLAYSAVMPPGGTPTPVSIDRTEPWPDASGEIGQWTLSFNGVGRWALGDRVNGQLSAGLSYFRIEGSARSVGYSAFQLGGHSVLFSDLYELALAVQPASSFGLNVGGGVDVRLRPHLSLTADFRFFDGRSISAPVVVSEVLNASDIISLESLESIQQTVRPQPLALSPARARFMVGIKAGF